MAETKTAITKKPRLWRNLNFSLMWTSTAASGFGDRMIMLAALALLGGLVEGTHNSTSVQASTQFWFFLPYILFSIPAGWIADRVRRKWLLLLCDESRGVILLLAFFAIAAASGVAALPSEYHWRVYMILFGVGICAAIFNTTRNAIIPEIVKAEQLQPGNAIIIGINMVAALIGMKVGAMIIHPEHATSVRNGLLIAACFYFVSGTFFAFMRIKNVKPNIPLYQSMDSSNIDNKKNNHRKLFLLLYILAHRRIVCLIVLNVLVWIIAAVVTSAILGVGKMLYNLQSHALESYFASMYVAVGAGMLIGAIATGALRIRRESLILTYFAMAGAGLCVLLMALVPIRWLGFLFAFGVGFLGNIVIVSIMTLLQSMSPNYIRGRVMGVNSFCISLFSVAAYLIVWQTPRADINITQSLYALGPLLIVVGVIGLWRYLISGHLTKKLNLIWRLLKLFTLVWHRLEWQGRHNIPKSSGVILASNHTSALDPLLIQSICRRPVRWVMLESYRFRVLNFAWNAAQPIFLERDAGDNGKIRTIVNELKNDEIVGLFPEGGLEDKNRQLKTFKSGLAMIAKRSSAAIVPIWIEGTPKKTSMILQIIFPSRSKIIIGKPYKPNPNDTHKQVTDELREKIEKLRHG